jgi:hypothetical protein
MKVFRVLMLVLVGAAFAFAQGTPAAPEAKKEVKKPAELKMAGKLSAVDLIANTINVDVVKGKETKIETLMVDTTTVINKKDKIDVLKTGDMVKVTYEEKDGKMVALKIKVVEPKAEKKAEAKPAPAAPTAK